MKGKENQDCTLEMKGFRVREKSIKGGSGRSTVEKHTEREENMKITFFLDWWFYYCIKSINVLQVK